MKYLRDLSKSDLHGKRVLLRLDLNVSIIDGTITDDYRIKRSLPTLNFLRDAGAKTIIVSHIESEGVASLKTVFEHLAQQFDVVFVPEYFTDTSTTMLNSLKEGSFALMENVRINTGEKKNDDNFSKALSALADIYINDAFAVSHREHASVVGVTKFLPSYAGLLFEEEIKNLSVAENPEHPFLFILGGAKFETKLPLIEKFLPKTDTIFLGGALANNVFKERGFNIGKSMFSAEKMDIGALVHNSHVIVPTDVIVKSEKGDATKGICSVEDGETIVDAGPESIRDILPVIAKAKFILWNGPLGLYEGGYKKATLEIAKAIAESDAHSVVGGGDTLAAISEQGLDGKFGFVSTGGGAMLDFLAKGTLPGIEALN